MIILDVSGIYLGQLQHIIYAPAWTATFNAPHNATIPHIVSFLLLISFVFSFFSEAVVIVQYSPNRFF